MAKKLSTIEKADKLIRELILELTISEGRRISLLNREQQIPNVSSLEIKILEYDNRRESLND